MKTRLGISVCEMPFSVEELQTCEQNVCGMQLNVHGPCASVTVTGQPFGTA